MSSSARHASPELSTTRNGSSISRRPSIMADVHEPRISIVIPIYNEQGILHSAVVDLRERLKPFGWNYEIILAENGSKDRTIELGNEIAAKFNDPKDGQVRMISM